MNKYELAKRAQRIIEAEVVRAFDTEHRVTVVPEWDEFRIQVHDVEGARFTSRRRHRFEGTSPVETWATWEAVTVTQALSGNPAFADQVRAISHRPRRPKRATESTRAARKSRTA